MKKSPNVTVQVDDASCMIDTNSLTASIRALVRSEIERVVGVLTAVGGEPPGEFLTTREASTIARTTPGTIRRWVREGRLTERRAGRQVRVLRSDLEEVLRPGRARSARRLTGVVGQTSPETAAAELW